MNPRIKQLAEQAGIHGGQHITIESLERFAKLIRADERDKCAQDYLKDCNNAIESAFNECKKEIEHNRKVLNIMIDTARKDEREACAKLCEGCMNQADPLIPVSTYQSGAFTIAEFLATAIRLRGEK